jgi:RNA polymerase sigma-70 factor (ECF subfamily)
MESMLLKKSIEGDIASFEELISKYNRYVYNIAYRMMGDEEDAKDMSQEALLKAFRSIRQFKMESNFSTWLYRIAINTCKDELRKRKEQVVSLDTPIGDKMTLGETLSDGDSANPILIYEKAELKVMIEKALDQLPEDGKNVVVLKDLLGYSYEEIGEMLEIPIGTVRSRLNRNRSALRKILQTEGRALYEL